MENMADHKGGRLEWLREHPEAAGSLSVEDSRRLLEELSLHHTDLYDFAPVAYLTLSAKGLIEEANLTAAALLGVPRRELVGRTLLRFITGMSRDEYSRHHGRVVESCRKDTAELQLTRNGGLFYGRLESVPVEKGGRVVSLRSALIDITGLKQAEWGKGVGFLDDQDPL
jgi:PAS domain S-box-containing protein